MASRRLTFSAAVLSLAFVGCFSPDESASVSETEGNGSTTDGPTTAAPPTTTSAPTTGSPTTNAPTTDTPTTDAPTTDAPTTDAPTTDDSSDDTTGTDTMDESESETTDTEACSANEVCVPTIPEGWTGPIAAGAPGDCPGGYPDAGTDLFDGLVPGVPQCSCNCNIASLECSLYLENEGQEFAPTQSCESPPFDDECLSAITQTTCADNGVDVPATPQWNSTLATCGGATAGNACAAGGTCFADDGGFGDICIQREGDHPCPLGFDERAFLHEGFNDTRECSACSCVASGQECEIQVEICSVGFFTVDLESGGSCQQLATSDGDGVSQLNTTITQQGSCSPANGAGMTSGDVTEVGPVTVCCM